MLSRKSLALIFLMLLSGTSYSQSEQRAVALPDCSVARIKPKPSKLGPISAGVLTGKALRLDRPVFPTTASAVNVRGIVLVSIVIDEAGCVSEAKPISGHPMLIPESLKAAKAAVFEPVRLSGNPVRVIGTISFSYISGRSNWLELGFSSNSYDTFLDYLPSEYDAEKELLRRSAFLDEEKRQETVDSIRKIIVTNLASDPKSQWLFSIGVMLRSFQDLAENTESRHRLGLEFRQHLGMVPNNVSPQLVKMISDLLDETDSSSIHKKIKDIELRMYQLGS